MITRYGLYWSERNVRWNRKGGSGGLQGKLRTYGKNYGKGYVKTKKEQNGEIVDYSDFKGVYALYDQFGKLVYVGKSGIGSNSIYKRLLDHRRGPIAYRWHYFSWFGFDLTNHKVNTKVTLKQMEAIGISIANPELNKKMVLLSKLYR